MGGYAISVNRFLSLTLSHHSPRVMSCVGFCNPFLGYFSYAVLFFPFCRLRLASCLCGHCGA